MPQNFEKMHSNENNSGKHEQDGLSYKVWMALCTYTKPIANSEIQLTAPSAKDVLGNHHLDPLAIQPSGIDHHTTKPVDIPKLSERIAARYLVPPVPEKLGVLRALRQNFHLPPKPEISRPPNTKLSPAMGVIEGGIGARYKKLEQQAHEEIKEDARNLVALMREMERIANDRPLGYMSIIEEARKNEKMSVMDSNSNERWGLAKKHIIANETNERHKAIDTVIDQLKDGLSVSEEESLDLQYTRRKLEQYASFTSEIAANVIMQEIASSPHQSEEEIHKSVSKMIEQSLPSFQSVREKISFAKLAKAAFTAREARREAEATVKEAQREAEVSLIVDGPPGSSTDDGGTRLG